MGEADGAGRCEVGNQVEMRMADGWGRVWVGEEERGGGG